MYEIHPLADYVCGCDPTSVPGNPLSPSRWRTDIQRE